MQGFSVYKFDRNTLATLMAKVSSQDIANVSTKNHFRFIVDRLKKLGTQSIIVEHNYIDHDYLSDYTEFHARSFYNYKRHCARLHFFDIDISPPTFKHIALHGGIAQKDAQSKRMDLFTRSYLGFIVVRPLPDNFFGKTCIKSPLSIDEADAGVWQTPKQSPYGVGLCGVRLEVHDTVAFQEQDSVVAACATCAVWFSRHAQSDRHGIPSPGALTRQAMGDASMPQRMFPNRGLDSAMIIRAMKRESYEVFAQEIKPIETSENIYREIGIARRIIYAYLRGSVSPSILGVAIHETETQSDGQSTTLSNTPILGRHAVTVLGYRLNKDFWTSDVAIKFYKYFDNNQASGDVGNDFHLMADSVSALLVHDDRVGPFVEMKFDEVSYSASEAKRDDNSASSDNKMTLSLAYNLTDSDESNPNVQPEGSSADSEKSFSNLYMIGEKPITNLRQVPTLLHLSAYHKIRVQFIQVQDYVRQLHLYFQDSPKDDLVKLLTGRTDQTSLGGIIWDIYVTDVTDAKASMRSMIGDQMRAYKERKYYRVPKDENEKYRNDKFCKRQIEEIALAYWPKYIWRATAFVKMTKDNDLILCPIFDLVIDSTDNLNKYSILKIVYYNADVEEVFGVLFKPDHHFMLINDHPIIKGCINSFAPKLDLPMAELDRKFGQAHPPRSIKSHEWDSLGVLNQQKKYPEACILLGDNPIRNDASVHERQLGSESPTSQSQKKAFAYEGVEGDSVRKLIAYFQDISKKEFTGIWLIDAFGTLILGRDYKIDNGSLYYGHPTLVGGDMARIGGEIQVAAKEWPEDVLRITLTNVSGRYCRMQGGDGLRRLKNVKDLLEQHLRKLDEDIFKKIRVCVQINDFFGPNRIVDDRSARESLKEMIDSYNNKAIKNIDRLTDFAIVWAEDLCDLESNDIDPIIVINKTIESLVGDLKEGNIGDDLIHISLLLYLCFWQGGANYLQSTLMEKDIEGVNLKLMHDVLQGRILSQDSPLKERILHAWLEIVNSYAKSINQYIQIKYYSDAIEEKGDFRSIMIKIINIKDQLCKEWGATPPDRIAHDWLELNKSTKHQWWQKVT